MATHTIRAGGSLPAGAGFIERPEQVPWGEIDVLLIDAPWPYRVRSRKGLSRSAENHYRTMTYKDLARLPIRDLLKPDAWVFAWVTMPGLLEQGDLIRHSWGLVHATTGFIWFKRTKHGKEHVGLGHYTRANEELCLLFKTGRGLRRMSRSVRMHLEAKLGEHSEKPKEVYGRIFQLTEGEDYSLATQQYTYMELFARNFWPGWLATGRDLPEKGKGPDIRDLFKERMHDECDDLSDVSVSHSTPG